MFHVSCCWFALLECRYTPVYLDEVIEDVHAVANFGSMSTLQVINQMLSVGRFHFGHIGFGLNSSRQIARQMDRNLVTGLLVWHCRWPAIYLRACLRGL